MSAHTPTPWVIRRGTEIRDENGWLITDIINGDFSPDDQEKADYLNAIDCQNAALIVRAVNRDHHFDALVKALEELLALPTSLRELAMLDKGIGTATPLAAWLRARDLVSRDVGGSR